MRLAFGIGLVFSLSASTALAGGDRAPLQIVVSRDQQSLVVYDGDTVIATSNVSTGKPGHSTPTGIFSILEKRRFHASNIYSNAPMPFMQRLTWSGIALHASNHVPNHPASHGCVRLPDDFAKQLFKMTSRGLHVLISDRQLVPQAISDPFLFQPAIVQPALLSDATLRPSVSHLPEKPVEVATIAPQQVEKPTVEPEQKPPIRILITRRDQRDITRDVQALLNQIGYTAGTIDGYAGVQTLQAVRSFQADEKMAVNGLLTSEFLDALYLKAGKGKPPNGQLFVRRDFEPLLDMPVTIENAEIALGTHFLQFQNIDAATGKGEWFVMSLDNSLPGPMKKRLGITVEEDASAFNAARRSMGRIILAQEARQKIEELLSEGSSLTISDLGLGQETGKGTDFVTITRTPPKS
ncbi:L,D-transpeptidase family protein [Rhizobium sp. Root482]|uniref:L,D-transpeptidase family protein n=1 Tax=Rhizobium sp. Root482 TaxID=1736543 RepID=UPI0019107C34|nr:L,D-transpeptidase family protein [Rhizobium sp. Root482]